MFFRQLTPVYIYNTMHSSICAFYIQEFYKVTNSGFLMRFKNLKYFLILMLGDAGEQILIPFSIFFSPATLVCNSDGGFSPFSGLPGDCMKCQAAHQYFCRRETVSSWWVTRSHTVLLSLTLYGSLWGKGKLSYNWQLIFFNHQMPLLT